MQSGKDLTGKTVIGLDEGRRFGTVKDLYLNCDLRSEVDICLRPESLLGRRTLCVDGKNVTVYGVDAVLASETDTIVDAVPSL